MADTTSGQWRIPVLFFFVDKTNIETFVFLEGGGWCYGLSEEESILDCEKRAKTALGSSRHYPKEMELPPYNDNETNTTTTLSRQRSQTRFIREETITTTLPQQLSRQRHYPDNDVEVSSHKTRFIRKETQRNFPNELSQIPNGTAVSKSGPLSETTLCTVNRGRVWRRN